MKIYAPDYYKMFFCIADKCKHNCCIGWEIDIDEETAEYYKSVGGKIGDRLRTNVSRENETPHFILGKEERCPFLNSNNLCDIIAELGEDKLCNICADHPRFRNFFGDRTEIGIGLCCEAAAELILNYKKRVEIVDIDDDRNDEEYYEEDELFFAIRQKVFDIIQNRKETFPDRTKRLIGEFDLEFPQKSLKEWVDIFLGLEHLDNAWVDVLNKMKNADCDFKLPDKMDIEFEQLLVYFVYRHFADGIFDNRFKERLCMSILGVYMIHYASVIRGNGFADKNILIDTARMYSTEIEYSEENIEELLKLF